MTKQEFATLVVAMQAMYRFDSESTFCNNSLDMGSSFSCVGTFICNADKKIA